MIVQVLLHLVNQLWKPRILIVFFYNEFNNSNKIGPHMSDCHMGLVVRKPVFCALNNKGRDQPAFPRSLISAFAIPLLVSIISRLVMIKKREYDQEIPQSQTADNPVAPRERAAQQSQDTRKKNKAKQSALSSPSR